MSALRAVLGSRYAGLAVVLLAGLAACQGVELGVGVKPAVPPPDPAMVKQIEEARTAVAAAEERAKEATRLAAEAEAARVAASASVADLERRVVAGEATQEDLDRARRRAAEAATEATQAKERADRARAWTDEFAARVATANDRLAKAEQAWRDAAGGGLDIEGPKDTSPWGLISWALSTGLLVVLNEKRKRDAKAALEEAKRDSRDVVARQDDAPFVGTAGRLAGVRCQAPMYTSSLSGLLRQASQSPRLVRFWGGLAPPEVPFGNSVSRVLHTAAGGNANPSTWEPGTNAPLLAR